MQQPTMLTQRLNNLPSDLINHIKEYTLSKDILLNLLYQKYDIDEDKIKKFLKSFTSQQLEKINWKYLYYKIYIASPPRCDNNNLVPFFQHLSNPKVATSVFHDGDRDLYDYDYEPFLIYNPRTELRDYRLHAITRSDYYSENVHTEKGRKRQQYRNIIDGWTNIRRGNQSLSVKKSTNSFTNNQPTKETAKIYNYFLNTEYNLIRAILILQKHLKNTKI